MCLKEPCFPECWKISSVVPVFENVGERCMAKNYHPVGLSLVSKIFEKLLEKCGLFSYFQYGFRSSWSTADLLTVASDRIVGSLNRSRVTQAVALDIFKAFDMPVFFTKSNLMEFQVGFWSYFVFCQTDLGGSRWEVLARVSRQCWNFSRLHSWSSW